MHETILEGHEFVGMERNEWRDSPKALGEGGGVVGMEDECGGCGALTETHREGHEFDVIQGECNECREMPEVIPEGCEFVGMEGERSESCELPKAL